jgi:hypothetical protein
MYNDVTRSGDLDQNRIALNAQEKIDYWTRRFGVTREHLEQAVEAVGDDPRAVQRQLEEHRFDRYLYEGCA